MMGESAMNKKKYEAPFTQVVLIQNSSVMQTVSYVRTRGFEDPDDELDLCEESCDFWGR